MATVLSAVGVAKAEALAKEAAHWYYQLVLLTGTADWHCPLVRSPYFPVFFDFSTVNC
jgi:hypothetical protein